MRPRRLELAGFTSFREPVTVDFSGTDLFALVGPTGAGKTSLIDGICFALYGTVPRGDRRAVAPVIAAGQLEARVRLDFSVGTRTYTAARVVRRMPRGGATTKEARLERGADVLAGDAEGVTAAVSDVLGLNFDQFTKCVVLPQGDFARFLHDKPRDRQDLLVRLLDLGVFDDLRQAARTREAAASSGAQVTQQRLEELAGATPEALAAAGERVSRLTALRDELDRAQGQLDDLTDRSRAARAAGEEAARHVELLDRLRVPDGVADLSAALDRARDAAERATDGVERAEARLAQVEAARAALPDPLPLERARQHHEEREQLRARLDKGERVVAEERRAEEQARARRDAAALTAEDAGERLESVRRAHAAAELAAHLVTGEPCPVCEQRVDAPPSRGRVPALGEADDAVASARSALADRERELRSAADQRVRSEEHLATLRERAAALDDAVRDHPDPAEVARLLAAIGDADRAVHEARAAAREASGAAREAARAADRARERQAEARAAFGAARDRVAALGPPPADPDDLLGAWRRLVAWAEGAAAGRRRAAGDAQTAATAAESERAALLERLAERCADCGVDVGRQRPRDACADALAGAVAERSAIAADRDRAERLRGELERHRERATVAGTLAQHLAANRFEQWLLDEALQRLASGATRTLRELSSGQYSLVVDAQRNFAVVDHRNADERRPARTLSGGETFLASLALALTLAEHVTDLAVDATPRLESMFLDEGFGTLDPATLDVVATAIEELGASGRTVGLVTHVRDLAERMPVRYEVRRGPAGSTVERVVA